MASHTDVSQEEGEVYKERKKNTCTSCKGKTEHPRAYVSTRFASLPTLS
jgi:hypothetical protein